MISLYYMGVKRHQNPYSCSAKLSKRRLIFSQGRLFSAKLSQQVATSSNDTLPHKYRCLKAKPSLFKFFLFWLNNIFPCALSIDDWNFLENNFLHRLSFLTGCHLTQWHVATENIFTSSCQINCFRTKLFWTGFPIAAENPLPQVTFDLFLPKLSIFSP